MALPRLPARRALAALLCLACLHQAAAFTKVRGLQA